MADLNNSTPAAETAATAGAVTPDTQAAAEQSAGTGAEQATAAKASPIQKLLDALGIGEKKESGNDAGATDQGDPAKQAAPAGKTYTEQELNGVLEAKRQEWQAELERQQQLSQMTPEQRAAQEQADKDSKISTLEAQLLQRDLKETAVGALENDGFPVSLAGLLDYSSKESMEKGLAVLTDTFKTCLTEAVNQKLRGKTPAGLGGAASQENALASQIAHNIRGGLS